jgi:C4-type Zn-finger protein
VCSPTIARLILRFTTTKVKNAELPFTLVLNDPLASSHLRILYASDPDPNMEVERDNRMKILD